MSSLSLGGIHASGMTCGFSATGRDRCSILGFQQAMTLSELESCLGTRAKNLPETKHWSRTEEERIIVLAGWSYNGVMSVEAGLNLCEDTFPVFKESSCCVWVELEMNIDLGSLISLTRHDNSCSQAEGESSIAKLSRWHSHLNEVFQAGSRVRELSSLVTAASLDLLPRVSSGLELYYVYCWEGVTATALTRARAMQAALQLEKVLLTAFYEARGHEDFLSQKILRSSDLFSTKKLTRLRCFQAFQFQSDGCLPPKVLTCTRALASKLAQENHLLFRLFSHSVAFLSTRRDVPAGDDLDTQSPQHDSTRDRSFLPPPTATDQVVTDLRYRFECMSETLPSKRLLASLMRPNSILQENLVSLASTSPAPPLGDTVSPMANQSRPQSADFPTMLDEIDVSSKLVTLGGSTSFLSKSESAPAKASHAEGEHHAVISRPISRPTLPQLKSLNLQRRRLNERRENSGLSQRDQFPLGTLHDSQRTSSLSATPHEREDEEIALGGDGVSTQRSLKARRIDIGSLTSLPSSQRQLIAGEKTQSVPAHPRLISSRSSSGPAPEGATSSLESVSSESASQSSCSDASYLGQSARKSAVSRPVIQLKSTFPPLAVSRPAIALSLGLNVTPPPPETMSSAQLPSRQSPDIDRGTALIKYKYVCSEIIHDQLYLAGEGVAQNLQILQDNRITHILNSAGDTCPNYFPATFHYLTFVLLDSRLTNEAMEAVLFPALNFIEKSINQGGRVLVHCREGVSRSCTFACAYLMSTRNWTFQTALDFIRSVRDVCNPNTGFTFTLLKFGKRLLIPANVDMALPGIGDKKLSRIALHHFAAPFMVVLGVSLWEPTHRSWMPGGKALLLDPRFIYVLRDQRKIYVWKGGLVPRHMEKVMLSTIESHIRDVQKYERLRSETDETIYIDEGAEPSEFWEIIHSKNWRDIPLAARITQQAALDEEANYLATEFVHITVFDVVEWEQELQIQSEEDGRRSRFVFLPPKATPRSLMDVNSRRRGLQQPKQEVPTYRGSYTQRGELNRSPLFTSGGRRAHESLGGVTPPSIHRRRRFCARPRLFQSADSPQLTMEGSRSTNREPQGDEVVLKASQTEGILHDCTVQENDIEEDYQSGFTRRSLLSVPQQSVAVGSHRDSDGAGKDGRYETNTLYAFTFPRLDEGLPVEDGDVVADRSSDVILFVIFGQSALTPVRLPSEGDSEQERLLPDVGHQTATDRDHDEEKSAGDVVEIREKRRNYTVPPITLSRKAFPHTIRLSDLRVSVSGNQRPATAGQELDLLGDNLQHRLESQRINDNDAVIVDIGKNQTEEDEWETTIWLWEGAQSALKSDDSRDAIINSFCRLHFLDPHLLYVYSEKEGAETQKFLEMLFLL